ncbi:MAG: hypothetical protein AAGF90_12760 [Pseudomonadota bacterium]
MRFIVVTLFAALFASPAAAIEDFGDRPDRKAACLDWIVLGFPSEAAEAACVAEFELPSPLLFDCARAGRDGFSSARQRIVCALLLAEAGRAAGLMRIQLR